MIADPSAWRVTVTVLAYRSASTVAAAVRSALEQEHAGHVDVHVREQGGDEGERRVLEGLATTAPNRSLVVEHGANLGFAGGHDRLLAGTCGDAVLLLNADARLAPGFLRAALPAFADPDVGAVQGKVLRPDASPPVIDAAGIVIERSRRAVARGQGSDDDGPFDEPGEVFGVDGAVALYRRTALDDVALPGGELLARDLGSYQEDVDLAWRLRWRGWRTRYEPGAIAWHARAAREDSGATALERGRRRAAVDAQARRQAFANARLLPLRVDPARRWVRDLAPILRREVGAWGVLAMTAPGDVVPVLGRLLVGLGPAVRARRAVLGRRAPGADPHAWLDRPFVANPTPGARQPRER